MQGSVAYGLQFGSVYECPGDVGEDPDECSGLRSFSESADVG